MRPDRPFRSLSTGEKLAYLLVSVIALIPFLVALSGFLLSTVPLFPPVPVVPNFGLALVFLFALYRPTQIPPWAAVPLGAAADLLYSLPLGVNAVGLPLFMAAVIWIDTNPTQLHWLADWAIAVPFLVGYEAFIWLLASIAGPSVPLLPFLIQGIATLAVFPLVAFLFVSVQRRFVDRMRV